MHVLRLACLIAAVCVPLIAAYQVKVPPDFGYGYICNGVYAGRNASVQGTVYCSQSHLLRVAVAL